MYKWDKNFINYLINYLYSLNSDLDAIKDDIEILLNINEYRISKDNEAILDNLFYEDEEYEDSKKYSDIIKKISLKYYTNKKENEIRYKTIDSSKKDILLFTRDNIKNINKNWAAKLEPHILENYKFLDFRKNNNNTIIFLEYLNNFYISLSKSNNITDFIYPTHEFLHILSYKINNKSLNSIESEFLSILGELITSHELKKHFLFKNELIKSEINLFNQVSTYVTDSVYKKIAIIEELPYDKKIPFLNKELGIRKRNLKGMYKTSLEYNYSFVISYFLALELFEIYIKDKEKCIYICENLIKSNKDLEQKLKDNHINLLENDDKYIKKIKKNILL